MSLPSRLRQAAEHPQDDNGHAACWLHYEAAQRIEELEGLVHRYLQELNETQRALDSYSETLDRLLNVILGSDAKAEQ